MGIVIYMTLSTNILDLEKAKFVDDSGNICIRAVATTASGDSSALVSSVKDLEKGKFVEDDSGDISVVCLAV